MSNRFLARRDDDGFQDSDLTQETQEVLPRDQEVLNPGEEHVWSFWRPILQAGKSYEIDINQTLKAPTGQEEIKLNSSQSFTVDAPRLVLPPGSVQSVYPAPGYSEEARILPHIVLTDPHLPWARGEFSTPSQEGGLPRPWLALLLFTRDELRLPLSVKRPNQQQTPTGAVKMTLNELHSLKGVKSSMGPSGTGIAQQARFIFIPKRLFRDLFYARDATGRETPNVEPYDYLAHVRKFNATGMAQAGVEQAPTFSLVVSRRCGPLNTDQLTNVSVHLVSLEGISTMTQIPTEEHVGMCSLHSWNYNVLALKSLQNVFRTFTSLQDTLGLLRAPDDIIDQLEGTAELAIKRLQDRLKDGYSLMRYKTQTGETTVALFRGPLTPTVVYRRPEMRQHGSNSGWDLQILDKEIAIMDISYSAAWNLGRMVAMSDQAFSAALLRLRMAIHRHAMRDAQTTAAAGKALTTTPSVLSSLTQLDKVIARSFQPGPAFSDAVARWHRHSLDQEDFPRLDFESHIVKAHYRRFADKAAMEFAKAEEGGYYDENNTAVSDDWKQILGWVMDRRFLYNVPAHYLLSDPSHLEPERLRFFYIDPNWTDALIDGALSLGNQMGGDDPDRLALKHALDRCLYPSTETQGEPPKIPIYGFFLRSDIVSRFPDLKVTLEGTAGRKAKLLRHEIIADGVMFCLFNCVPSSDDFGTLLLTQPPHQQRFAVGKELRPDSVTVNIRPLTAAGCPDQVAPLTGDTEKQLFIWKSSDEEADLRLLNLPKYAGVQLQMLRGSGNCVETNPTSALLALQLSDPTYQLRISLKDKATVLDPLVPPNVTPSSSPSVSSNPRSSEAEDDGEQGQQQGQQQDEQQDQQPRGGIPVRPKRDQASFPGGAAELKRTVVDFDPSAPAHSPVYHCSVHSIGQPHVQMDADHQLQDLVFSIQVTGNIGSYELCEFHIRVPLIYHFLRGPSLLSNYTGPGPVMLSNLRFNVHHRFEDSDLILTLLPRSRSGSVRMSLVREMSFLLGLACVSPELTKEPRLSYSYRYTTEDFDRNGQFPVKLSDQL